jgi:hypothetical protein
MSDWALVLRESESPTEHTTRMLSVFNELLSLPGFHSYSTLANTINSESAMVVWPNNGESSVYECVNALGKLGNCVIVDLEGELFKKICDEESEWPVDIGFVPVFGLPDPFAVAKDTIRHLYQDQNSIIVYGSNADQETQSELLKLSREAHCLVLAVAAD